MSELINSLMNKAKKSLTSTGCPNYKLDISALYDSGFTVAQIKEAIKDNGARLIRSDTTLSVSTYNLKATLNSILTALNARNGADNQNLHANPNLALKRAIATIETHCGEDAQTYNVLVTAHPDLPASLFELLALMSVNAHRIDELNLNDDFMLINLVYAYSEFDHQVIIGETSYKVSECSILNDEESQAAGVLSRFFLNIDDSLFERLYKAIKLTIDFKNDVCEETWECLEDCNPDLYKLIRLLQDKAVNNEPYNQEWMFMDLR